MSDFISFHVDKLGDDLCLDLSSLRQHGLFVNKLSEKFFIKLREIESSSGDEALSVAFKVLYSEISAYCGFLLDISYYKSLGLEIIEDKWEYPKAILENREVSKLMIFSHHVKRGPATWKHELYFFILKLLRVNKFLIAANPFLIENVPSFVWKLPNNHIFKSVPDENIVRGQALNIQTDILEACVLAYGEEFFSEIDKKNLKLIISSVFDKIKKLNGNLRNFHFSSKTKLYAGTGGNLASRFLALAVSKAGGEVSRFEHGGERAFFIDSYFCHLETFYSTNYFFFGEEKGDLYRGLFLKYHPSLRIYSKPFKGLKKSLLSSHSKDASPDFIYVPGSYLGRVKQYPNAAFDDVFRYFWQKKFLPELSRLGSVMVKKHPKGFLKDVKEIENPDIHFNYESFNETLKLESLFIFDHAGSAFYQAIKYKKKILYIDLGIRPLSRDGVELLRDWVSIVSYQEFLASPENCVKKALGRGNTIL